MMGNSKGSKNMRVTQVWSECGEWMEWKNAGANASREKGWTTIEKREKKRSVPWQWK